GRQSNALKKNVQGSGSNFRVHRCQAVTYPIRPWVNIHLTVNLRDARRPNKRTQKGELRVRKALISMLVSAAMVMGQLPVMAADTGPLTPGAAAGVQQAQGRDDIDNP